MAQLSAKRMVSFGLAAAMSCALMFPATAFAVVSIDGQELAEGDNAVGGGNASLYESILNMTDVRASNMYVDEDLSVNFNGGNEIGDFTIGGSATVDVDYSGSNNVEDTHVRDNANATINANGNNEFEEVKAYDNANVTVNVTGENDFECIEATENANVTVRGTTCQKRDIANVGVDEHNAGLSAQKGNVAIDHVTVNLRGEADMIGSESGSLTVDTSKIAHADGNNYALILAGKTMRIFESVIEIVGTIHSRGLMTIEHSDVEAKKPSSSDDDSPYRVYSETGIDLIRERNGSVEEGEIDGKKVWYVDTDDNEGSEVDLEADGTPAYYKCGDAEKEPLAKTADTTSAWGLVASVFALASMSFARLARRRN